MSCPYGLKQKPNTLSLRRQNTNRVRVNRQDRQSQLTRCRQAKATKAVHTKKLLEVESVLLKQAKAKASTKVGLLLRLLANYLLPRTLKDTLYKDMPDTAKRLNSKEALSTNIASRKNRKVRSDVETVPLLQTIPGTPPRYCPKAKYWKTPRLLNQQGKMKLGTLHPSDTRPHTVFSPAGTVSKTASVHLTHKKNNIYFTKARIQSEIEYFFEPLHKTLDIILTNPENKGNNTSITFCQTKPDKIYRYHRPKSIKKNPTKPPGKTGNNVY